MSEPTSPASALSADDLRALIVSELRIAGLSPEKQDKIILEVSKSLLERAALAVMSRLPIETIEKIDQLSSEEQISSLLNAANSSNPGQLQEVIRAALQEGLQKYQQFVDEEVGKARK